MNEMNARCPSCAHQPQTLGLVHRQCNHSRLGCCKSNNNSCAPITCYVFEALGMTTLETGFVGRTQAPEARLAFLFSPVLHLKEASRHATGSVAWRR
jgi:hypothetical protein